MNEFGNRLYELRKKSGLSQEKLAEKLNVSRQTLSKWELGESTPDMEKLIAISDLFEISLDELILGSEQKTNPQSGSVPDIVEKVLTPQNKRRAKKVGKILLNLFGVILTIDIISMILYFVLYGAPK